MSVPRVILFSGVKRSGKDTAAEMIVPLIRTTGRDPRITAFANPLKKYIQNIFSVLPSCALYGTETEKEEGRFFRDCLLNEQDAYLEMRHLFFDSCNEDDAAGPDLVFAIKSLAERVAALRKNVTLVDGELFCPDFSGRKLMQQIGTEVFRELVDKDFWVKCADRNVTQYPYTDRVSLLTDARFLTEIEYGPFADAPLIFVTGRGNTGDAHSSEAMVSDPNFANVVLARKNGFVVDNSGTLDDLRVQIADIARKLGF